MSYIEIGKNLKAMRIMRRLTIKDLSSEVLRLTGQNISPTMISYWENGDRRMYADQLEALCIALDCSPANVLPSFKSPTDQHTIDRYMSLPESEKDIIKFCAMSWEGNSRALVYFMGLYMALDASQRKDLAEYGIWRYEQAKMAGKLNPTAPDVPFEYIEEQAKRILK